MLLADRVVVITGGGRGTELRTFVGRLRALAKDDTLEGLFLRVEPLAISLPDLIELRSAMFEFRNAGKKLYCHTEAAENARATWRMSEMSTQSSAMSPK